MAKRSRSRVPGPAAQPSTGSGAVGEQKAVAASLEAYQQVRELIVSGRLAPGAPLIETDLSLRLGVSRTPVRAALQRLQQEGFVVGSRVGHMVRAVVSPLTADDLDELFLIVGALEAIASRRAARLEPRARHPLVRELERLNKEMRTAASAHPPQIGVLEDLHEHFHESVEQAAAGPRLRAELRALRPQTERYGRAYTGAYVREFEVSLAEHEAIIRAIRAGDADAAERAAAANWRSRAERYRQIVRLHGERGSW
jgi:DNA-binding GntR family transcriptional regulator